MIEKKDNIYYLFDFWLILFALLNYLNPQNIISVLIQLAQWATFHKTVFWDF